MKRFILLSLVLFTLSFTNLKAQCCMSNVHNQVAPEVETNIDQENAVQGIEAYYFHFSRRCATCIAVEKVAADGLKNLYGESLVLKSVNLDDDANNKLAKRIGVSGQSLLFVKGDKKIDITSDGFLYARSKPEKLIAKINEVVDSLKD